MRFEITWVKTESTTYRAVIHIEDLFDGHDLANDTRLLYATNVADVLAESDGTDALEQFETNDAEVRCHDGRAVVAVVPT